MRMPRIVLPLLLVVTLLSTSCGLNPPPQSGTPINVAIVMYPGGGAPPQTLALYKAALEITKAAAGEFQLNMVTVNVPMEQLQKQAPQPSDVPPTVSALEQALGQDPPPDVVLFNSTYEFSSAVDKELLADVDQYMRGDKAAPREDYFPGMLEAVGDGSRIYGLPIAGGPTVLQYDKRLFDAAGLGAPSPNWTWSEFLDVARRLTKVTGDQQNDQYAINLMMGPNVLPAFVWQNGGEIVSKDGRRAMVGEPSAIEAIKFYYDLTESYKVAAPVPKSKEGMAMSKPVMAVRPGSGDVPPLMAPSGRVAMTFVSNAGSPMGMGYWGFQGEDRPMRFAELPRGKMPATVLDIQTIVAVTSKAKNPRLAYRAAVALATEMQKELPVPARRSLAKNLRQMNPGLAEDDAQVILNAMEYARPWPLNGSAKIMRPLYEKLLGPLQNGTKTPAEAAKDAMEAIDQALNEPESSQSDTQSDTPLPAPAN